MLYFNLNFYANRQSKIEKKLKLQKLKLIPQIFRVRALKSYENSILWIILNFYFWDYLWKWDDKLFLLPMAEIFNCFFWTNKVPFQQSITKCMLVIVKWKQSNKKQRIHYKRSYRQGPVKNLPIRTMNSHAIEYQSQFTLSSRIFLF